MSSDVVKFAQRTPFTGMFRQNDAFNCFFHIAIEMFRTKIDLGNGRLVEINSHNLYFLFRNKKNKRNVGIFVCE